MKTKVFFAAAVLMVSAACSSEVASQAENRSSLNLTVYNNNRALVQEVRRITLPAGNSTIRFEGVAQNIIPQSLIVVSSGSGRGAAGFRVLEQNYEFDLISREKLLEKFVGKDVVLLDEDHILGGEKRVPARLIANSFAPVFEVDGQILLGFGGQILLPELPANLYARPTLNWLVNAPRAGEFTADVSYLTAGINWNADYVMLLADDDKSASITAWVTLTNQSGAAFENANLRLIAGDVNMVRNQEQLMRRRGEMHAPVAMGMADAAEPMMEQRSFDEFHLYTVANPVSVGENQTKQIEMFSAQNVRTQRRYRIQGGGGHISVARNSTDRGNPLPVQSQIVFQTGRRNNLDMPFPRGVMRIYKRDGAANVFIGEDNVRHTPVNEEIVLRTGNAFDITAFERMVSQRQINPQRSEFTKEITVSNHKREAVSIQFDENLWGNWTIKSDTPHTAINANTARFELNVPAGRTITLQYTVNIER